MPRTVRPPFKLRIKLREELQKFTMSLQLNDMFFDEIIQYQQEWVIQHVGATIIEPETNAQLWSELMVHDEGRYLMALLKWG